MGATVREESLYRGSQAAELLRLRLFVSEWRTLAPDDWKTRDVRSSYWRFYANADPGAFLTLAPDGGGEEVYPLEAGTHYFVPAGVRFHCGLRPGARVGHFYVHFDVVGLPGLALRELYPRPVRLPPDPAREREVLVIADALRDPAAAADALTLHCRLNALLYGALAAHFAALDPADRRRYLERAAARAPVLPALECVEADLTGDLGNARLASLCFLSEDHFARRFRAAVGVPPAVYVRQRRVEAAAQRLLFTDESIDAVAESCGFSNRFYFTRVFTRETGLPPAAYRRRQRV